MTPHLTTLDKPEEGAYNQSLEHTAIIASIHTALHHFAPSTSFTSSTAPDRPQIGKMTKIKAAAMTTSTMTTARPSLQVLFISLILCTTFITTEAEQVVRQNIGLIYEQLPGQVITGHDRHQIILAIPYKIPQIPHTKPPIYDVIKTLQLPSLGPSDRHDAKILQQASDLDKLIQNIDQNILITMKNILHFLSDPINNRPKRAFLSFLGELFKSVFGLATTSDIHSIINVINHLDRKIGTLANINVEVASGLQGISKQHNEFLDTYIKEQDIIEQALLNITESIDTWSDDFSTTLTSLQVEQDRKATQSAIISAQTVVLLARLAYQQGLAKVENSLRLLSTGILAPDMIRPTELADKLKLLDIQLKLNNPGSEVTIIDTAYYYSQPVALYTYSRTHLYIHINVIISSTDSAFNLYQVITTDVPINTEETNTTGTTKITTHNTFLAVNEAGTLFLEMSSADLLTCQGRILKVCARTIPRIRTDNPTCLIAAFRDDQVGVARLCTFQIQPLKPIPTRAIALHENRYLITTNQEYYHIICQHKTPITRKASAYSVVGVPCLCHIQVGGLYLPNTQIPCNTTAHTHYIMHTANVPIIMALSTIHTDISPSSLHEKPIKIPHLHTQAIIKSLDPLHNLPTDVTMDLVPFTTKILEDAKTASTDLHRPLRNSPVADDIVTFFNHSAWTYITPVLTIINSLVVIVLIFKTIGRQAIFTAIPTASALPHNITWKHIIRLPQHTAKSTPKVHIDQYVDAENIFTIIIIALITYTAFKVIKSLKTKVIRHFGFTHTTRKTNPTVTLKIYNGHNNHTIPLISIPYESDAIHKGFTPLLKEIIPLSCPHPRVSMAWSGPITFNINGQQQTFYLPNNILLPLKARFSIIPALKDPTTTTALILKTHDTVTSLPTTIHNDTPDDSTNDHNDPFIHHPKDMTVLQLLSAVVKPKPQLGNEQ